MKFIRKEFIVTTMFDKELTEKDEIFIVLRNLLHESIEFSMIMKKFMLYQHDYFNISFEKVKIIKFDEENETVDLLVFKKGTKTSMKNVNIDDIIEIKSTTKKHKIFNIDSNPDRFDLLDL